MNQGLKNFKQAEDYLLLAKYALFKSKKKGYKVRYQLHRNLGILYTFKKQYKEALLELSNDVIYNKYNSVNLIQYFIYND